MFSGDPVMWFSFLFFFFLHSFQWCHDEINSAMMHNCSNNTKSKQDIKKLVEGICLSLECTLISGRHFSWWVHCVSSHVSEWRIKRKVNKHHHSPLRKHLESEESHYTRIHQSTLSTPSENTVTSLLSHPAWNTWWSQLFGNGCSFTPKEKRPIIQHTRLPYSTRSNYN